MLLWKRYGNNKMAAMRYYVLHLQQYSHRLNLLYLLLLLLLLLLLILILLLLLPTAIELSFGGPYTSTSKTKKNKYT